VLLFAREGGSCQVEEYLESLDDSRFIQINALIERCADDGPVFREGGPCRALRGFQFYEFKARRGQRVFWYRKGSAMILLHGFTKKAEATPRRELETAASRFAASEREAAMKGISYDRH